MLQTLHKVARWAKFTTTRCPVCSALTHDRQDQLCATCAESLGPRTGGYCPGCGDIFGDEDTPPTLCGECRTTPEPWDHLYFHNVYAGKLRDLILGYKFNGGISSTRLLADMAYISFNKKGQRPPDIIVPVPLHTRRLLWRGYNQSVELCRRLSKELSRPIVHDGLIRTRHTPPQTRLGMAERKENIKNAFAADPEKVGGKVIMIVDDVYTTGATLRECTKTLKQAGAAGVDVLVLARALQ